MRLLHSQAPSRPIRPATRSQPTAKARSPTGNVSPRLNQTVVKTAKQMKPKQTKAPSAAAAAVKTLSLQLPVLKAAGCVCLLDLIPGSVNKCYEVSSYLRPF